MEINKIYLGNAYELIKQIPSKTIDLIITDPPYEISGLDCKARNPTGCFKEKPRQYLQQMSETNLGNGIDLSILEEFVRVLKKINIYIWCNKEQLYDYLAYFVKRLKCNWEIIVWAKTNVPPFTNGHYLKDKEYCVCFWEKGVKIRGNYDTLKSVYVSQTNVSDKEEYEHPTIKPIDIIENFVVNSSDLNDIVLDPFLGSGTTCVAAKNLERQFIGFEINKNYFAIAKNRLNGINRKGQMSLLDTNFEQLDIFGGENE